MIRVGEVYVNIHGNSFRVTEYINNRKIKIKFINTGYEKYTISDYIYNGKIKDIMQPNLFGVGYIGEGIYKSRHNGKDTFEYTKWYNMLARCYANYNTIYTSYTDCIVCNEWHNFQIFANWVSKQRYETDWDLDKDLLSGKAKIYSPETCVFLPREINIVITKKNSFKYPNGVQPSLNKYYASFGRKYLGTFNTIGEASSAHVKTKKEKVIELANKWKNHISDKAYSALINYSITLTT